MGSLDRRIQELEEQFAATSATPRPLVRPEMRAALDRIAAIRRKGAEASDEERAELAGFERELKAEQEKRWAEGRI